MKTHRKRLQPKRIGLGDELMYHKILLPTDGSEHSARAAEHAVRLARYNPQSVLHMIYVVDPDTAKSDVLRYWNDIDIHSKQREKFSMVEQIVKRAGISYEVHIKHGDPGPKIVQFANKHQFDLVVIGSRGLNTLQELVLGSVSHKVAKRADCPVLIVK